MSSKKKILVTGSNGFVGRSLVKRLKKLDCDVITYDLDKGNIAVDRLNLNGIDHVFHLASRVYVPDSWEQTFDFYQTNVMGTVNVLELCRENGCSMTYISSYVYGTPQYLPVDEKHPVSPASPYNHSKLVAEDICRYYAQTFGFPVAVLRPVNIYGPGQSNDFLIPTIIRQVLDPSVTLIEVMDLRPKRDYLYIDDFIEVLVLTMQTKGFEIYNIGSGYSVSVEEIISVVLKQAKIQKPYSAKNVERKNEVWDVYNDISKIKRLLNWQPNTPFSSGIFLCINKFK
jgi:nucleoside-diphosphate-sugar epimerase